MIIAIDGPAGSGKSTVSKRVAKELGYVYLDTGAMYRCVGLLAKRKGMALDVLPDNAQTISLLAKQAHIVLFPIQDPNKRIKVHLNGQDVTDVIREPSIDAYASAVAVLPEVREVLVEKQRELARRSANVVLEGRDTTTVLFPDAEVKVFLVASPSERALRRAREDFSNLSNKSEDDLKQTPEYKNILKEINERDYQDEHRAASPLKKAHDAQVLDSTKLGISEVVHKIVSLAKEHMA